MSPNEAKTIMDFMAPAIEREVATTARVLAAMPEGHDDYAPSEKCMKALDLAWHIAGADYMFVSGIATGKFDTAEGGKRPDAMNSGAAISAWYKAEVGKAAAALKKMT